MISTCPRLGIISTPGNNCFVKALVHNNNCWVVNLKLTSLMLVGKGELKNFPPSEKMQADLVEALLGAIYKYLIFHSLNHLWAAIFISPLWINIAANGTPGTKVLGWAIMYFIACVIFQKYLMKPIDNYIKTTFINNHESNLQ